MTLESFSDDDPKEPILPTDFTGSREIHMTLQILTYVMQCHRCVKEAKHKGAGL